MKKLILFGLAVLGLLSAIPAEAKKTLTAQSPEGKLRIAINLDRTISYSLSDASGRELFSQDSIMLRLDKNTLGLNARLKKSTTRRMQETVKPVVPRNWSTIRNSYTLVELRFSGFDLQFRLMDNALAYRFLTHQGKEMTVRDEPVAITLAQPRRYTAHTQQIGLRFRTAYEEPYSHESATKDFDRCVVPALFSDEESDLQLLFGETNVIDYPRMFLGLKGGRLRSAYPPATLKWEPSGDRGLKETVLADYIAKTRGERALPWRYVLVTDSKGLLSQSVKETLDPKCKLSDTSWIKPGNVMWDWINQRSVFGPDVHFKSGVNFDTYKYFVDFAADHKMGYILLDEGWAKDTRDPSRPKDEVRLPELISYAHSKGVGVILWLPWLTTEQHPECFAMFEKWGVDGLKIDFMDCSDQWMVKYYERAAKACADHHLVLDFHGSYTPAGLEGMYPNLLAYEGVRGAEQMGGCSVDNSLYLPFIRNAVGPMDFTPGFLTSTQPDRYPNPAHTVAMGTRAYQLALFVVFTTGTQMLSDSPSVYKQDEDCARFMTSAPVVWDETRVLFARTGQYLGVARRHGTKWYIGAICNSKSAGSHTVSLDFLSPGSHTMTAFSDGPNAYREARDYQMERKTVDSSTTLEINMTRNGGFAAVIE